MELASGSPLMLAIAHNARNGLRGMHLVRSLDRKLRARRAEGDDEVEGEVVVDEDRLRRFLAASLVHSDARLSDTPLASLAKAWAKKEKKRMAAEEEDAKNRSAAAMVGANPVKTLALRAWGVACRIAHPSGQQRTRLGPDEGTAAAGEEGEVGWSEDAVEWCGIRYARDNLPPFDAIGLRDKTAYNPNHALWLATAAALAYRSPAQIRHVVTRIWQWEDTAFFHDAATDSQGFGMYGDASIVICFRGTESVRDYSTNTRAAKARHGTTVPFPGWPDVKVHRGYNTALLSLWAQVVAFIDKALYANPALPLYITGHSLGGALATLCLAYLSFPSPYPLPIPRGGQIREKESAEDESRGSSGSMECISHVNAVYTFGQLKVGNIQFVSELRARTAGVEYFRLTHDNDFLPLLPQRPAYVHFGVHLFLSHGHIVQGAEDSAQLARHVFRKTSSKRMIMRKWQGTHDHFVKAYVTFLREHYRINEPILTSLPKDVPLLRFHDLERAKRLRDELKGLGDFGSVMERLRQLTLVELVDLRSVTLTAKQRKRENRALGARWLRVNLWEFLQHCEQQRIEEINIMLRAASTSSADDGQ